MKRNRKRVKVILILTVFSLLLIVAGAAGMIIYPYYNEILLIKEAADPLRLSESITIGFYQTISPKIDIKAYDETFDDSQSLEYLTRDQLSQYYNEGSIANRLEPKNSMITIPSINVDAYILDGETAHRMDYGPWHFPLSSYPGAKGNMVIIGHRFAELPPSQNTFFNLDKIMVGDKILITQKGGISYTYTVTETKVVEKNDRSVLADHGDYRITLITCTPLWTSKQRLVITGILDKAYSNI